MVSDRRVLQLLPAPVDPTDGRPVFRVARYSCGTLTVAPVAAWALVRYGVDQDAYEAIEPVFHDPEGGMMRVGRPEDGRPADVVLSPGQVAVDVEWSKLSDADPRSVGTIEVETTGAGSWCAVERTVERPAKPAEPGKVSP